MRTKYILLTDCSIGCFNGHFTRRPHSIYHTKGVTKLITIDLINSYVNLKIMIKTPLVSFLFACLSVPLLCYEYGPYPSPRLVETKQGTVQGTIKTLRNLDPVEVYLGIPYAAAPLGTQRFMPPASPPPWSGTRVANSFGPVCPQNFPPRPGTTMPMGRWGYMDRVRHFLSNQSEDCLYLNIYAPVPDGGQNVWDKPASRTLPVIVFIHGESFEWSSGNLYDGSVLASYGKVIVVTINFRLGILGFLKPGVSDHVPSNFGLFDQVAALEWIRGNIAQFGGDPRSVTLMGHGTGAACVSYLMISPLAQAEGSRGGLFQRAILMSGTALSDWALTSSPVHVTIQVAQALNCPDSEDRMADCLRRKRLHELMSVGVHVPPFKTPFGPVVDGQVIPNEPALLMSQYKNLFQQYDLLCGLTEMESYYLLNDVDLVHGMIENDFYQKLNDYLNAKFEKLPELARTKTISYYRTWEKHGDVSAAESHRNTLLEILSDARVAAPVVQTADYHSQSNPKSYFYVFKHLTKYADFHPWIQQSVEGEELPYVFGVPLDGRGLRHDNNFSPQEKLLSEVVMTLWTNFAKTGNPNAPRRHNFLSQSHREWRQYEVDWPEYNTYTQQYYSIDIPPTIQQYYRQDKLAFWNRDLPFSLNNTNMPYRPTQAPWPPPGDPIHQDTDARQPPPPPVVFRPVVIVTSTPDTKSGQAGTTSTETDDSSKRLGAIASSVTFSIVIFVGICFLLVNLCAFIGLYYQRDKLRVRERLVSTRYRCVNVATEENDVEDHYTKSDSRTGAGEAERNVKTTEIKSILKSSDCGTYEQVKPESGKTASIGRTGKRMGISRQASSSTVTIDPHTKVKEWIAQEIVQRCSPRFLRRGKKTDLKTGSIDTYGDQLDQISNNTLDSSTSKVGSLTTLHKPKAKKVSVAVDATPATRSASILQQTPIELTKSMDEGLVSSGKLSRPGKESLKASTSLVTILKRPSLQRSEAMSSDDMINNQGETLRRSTSINLQLSKITESTPKITHFHSNSDPSEENPRIVNITFSPEKGPCEVIYSQVQKRPKVASQVHGWDKKQDVNVTSRDDLTKGSEMSAEEALDSIKRRNCPKVLPDYPDEENFHLQKATNRRSLPLNAQFSTDPGGSEDVIRCENPLGLKVPPPPPPRVSTLGRKPTNTSPVTTQATSQLSVKLKPTETVPVALRQPIKIPLSTPTQSVTSPVEHLPSHSHVKRIEPRVIIKPTMNPITGKKDVKQSNTSGIPRVTPPQPTSFGSSKDLTVKLPTPAPSKIPEMGMGRKTKITPVKKTVSTETALDNSATKTGTVKRINK